MNARGYNYGKSLFMGDCQSPFLTETGFLMPVKGSCVDLPAGTGNSDGANMALFTAVEQNLDAFIQSGSIRSDLISE